MEIYTNPEGAAWLEAAPHPDINSEVEDWNARERYYTDHGLPALQLVSHHDLVEETDLGIGPDDMSGPRDASGWRSGFWRVDAGEAYTYTIDGFLPDYLVDWGGPLGPPSHDSLGPSYSEGYAGRHQLRERSLVSKD